MPARAFAKTGGEKCRAAYRLADNCSNFSGSNKKIAASGNLPSVQECAQQCRHHWRPQTRQRPKGMYSPGNRQRPGFMHPSSIGECKIIRQSPISSRHRSRTSGDSPERCPSRCVARQSTPEFGVRIFFCQPRGNSPGKERASASK